MDLQILVGPGLSLAVAVAAAWLIGKFLAPSLESRKMAAVASSEESETFAQHLHLMAGDLRLAAKYEALALQGVEGNVPKVYTLLDDIGRRANKAAKIARAGKRVRFSEKRREYASLVIGLVLKFRGQQYPAIRKGQAYFKKMDEVKDHYLEDLADLLDFASKVFQPRKFVWFPLRRLDKKLKAFMASTMDDLQQAHMADLHELGLRMSAEEPPEEEDTAEGG
ncbi:hypothetical protein [Paenarthrobacter sp. NPDC089316]|uniref:hypothetical protein n=1 Tax=unclassified Paenarthrobacter TaxID=2634190 RepID=UPI00342C43A7